EKKSSSRISPSILARSVSESRVVSMSTNVSSRPAKPPNRRTPRFILLPRSAFKRRSQGPALCVQVAVKLEKLRVVHRSAASGSILHSAFLVGDVGLQFGAGPEVGSQWRR